MRRIRGASSNGTENRHKETFQKTLKKLAMYIHSKNLAIPQIPEFAMYIHEQNLIND